MDVVVSLWLRSCQSIRVHVDANIFHSIEDPNTLGYCIFSKCRSPTNNNLRVQKRFYLKISILVNLISTSLSLQTNHHVTNVGLKLFFALKAWIWRISVWLNPALDPFASVSWVFWYTVSHTLYTNKLFIEFLLFSHAIHVNRLHFWHDHQESEFQRNLDFKAKSSLLPYLYQVLHNYCCLVIVAFTVAIM